MQEQREEWRAVEALSESQVWVSTNGEVKYVDKLGEEHRTFGTYDGAGYRTVNIKGKYYMVHRLIANAFLDSTFAIRKKDDKLKRDTDHINCNRADNRLDNLRILSHQANCSQPNSRPHYAAHNGRLDKVYAGIRCIDKETGETVREFRGHWSDIAEFVNSLKDYSFSPLLSIKSNITMVTRNGNNAYGYKWQRIPKKLTEWEKHLKEYRHRYHLEKKKK